MDKTLSRPKFDWPKLWARLLINKKEAPPSQLPATDSPTGGAEEDTPMNQGNIGNRRSSSNPFSNEFPQLLEKHLDHLKASGISIDVVKDRGRND